MKTTTLIPRAQQAPSTVLLPKIHLPDDPKLRTFVVGVVFQAVQNASDFQISPSELRKRSGVSAAMWPRVRNFLQEHKYMAFTALRRNNSLQGWACVFDFTGAVDKHPAFQGCIPHYADNQEGDDASKRTRSRKVAKKERGLAAQDSSETERPVRTFGTAGDAALQDAEESSCVEDSEPTEDGDSQNALYNVQLSTNGKENPPNPPAEQGELQSSFPEEEQEVCFLTDPEVRDQAPLTQEQEASLQADPNSVEASWCPENAVEIRKLVPFCHHPVTELKDRFLYVENVAHWQEIPGVILKSVTRNPLTQLLLAHASYEFEADYGTPGVACSISQTFDEDVRPYAKGKKFHDTFGIRTLQGAHRKWTPYDSRAWLESHMPGFFINDIVLGGVKALDDRVVHTLVRRLRRGGIGYARLSLLWAEVNSRGMQMTGDEFWRALRAEESPESCYATASHIRYALQQNRICISPLHGRLVWSLKDCTPPESSVFESLAWIKALDEEAQRHPESVYHRVKMMDHEKQLRLRLGAQLLACRHLMPIMFQIRVYHDSNLRMVYMFHDAARAFLLGCVNIFGDKAAQLVGFDSVHEVRSAALFHGHKVLQFLEHHAASYREDSWIAEIVRQHGPVDYAGSHDGVQ